MSNSPKIGTWSSDMVAVQINGYKEDGMKTNSNNQDGPIPESVMRPTWAYKLEQNITSIEKVDKDLVMVILYQGNI